MVPCQIIYQHGISWGSGDYLAVPISFLSNMQQAVLGYITMNDI